MATTSSGGCLACALERTAELLFLDNQHTCSKSSAGTEDRYSLDQYQQDARKTAIYPGRDNPNISEALTYVILKLNGEAGEAAEALGKYLRGDYDEDKLRALLIKELGDVLWYVANATRELGFNLSDIATVNISKLAKRAQDGTIRGSGDDR